MNTSTISFENEGGNATENGTDAPSPVSCKTQTGYGEDYQLFETIVNVGIIPCFIAFGIAGNVTSFVTLKHMKQATVILLLRALAAADSIYLITCLSFQSFRTLFTYYKTFSRFLWVFPYIFVSTWPIASMAQTASVWLVVLVTFDRYEAVVHAMAVAKYMTKRKVRIYIALVFVASISFNLPTAFDVRVMDRRPFCPNIDKVDWYPTAFYQDPLYDLVYKTILSITFRVALPVFIVITLNLWMLYQIKKSEEYRSGMAQRASSGIRSINVMVGIITLVFLICELPDLVYRVLRVIKFYRRQSLMTWKRFAHFAQISNLFLTINSSTNFLWYCLAGSKFRETLMWKFCGQGPPGGAATGTLVTLSTRRTTTSSTPSPGTPLLLGNPGRPLSLPGTPLIRAGNVLAFPVSASLTTQRLLSGDFKASANSGTLLAPTPAMSSSSSDVLINTSVRSSATSTPKFGSMSVRFANEEMKAT